MFNSRKSSEFRKDAFKHLNAGDLPDAQNFSKRPNLLNDKFRIVTEEIPKLVTAIQQADECKQLNHKKNHPGA